MARKKASQKKSEEPRKEPVIDEADSETLVESPSESVMLDEALRSADEHKSDGSDYSTEFISFAAAITSSLRKLDERIALLDEHHTNIELLIGAASRTVEKQKLYTFGSAAITVGGLIISAIIVVIAATTIGGFNRQFMSLSEAMMVQITDLNTGVEYLELTQDSIAALQNNVSELVVESRMGLETLNQAFQDSASMQSESSTQLANTINEANQYDYQSLVGLSDSIQAIVGRLSDLENQMVANDRQVQQLTAASESIEELNNVVQALLVLEQEKYLEVLESLAPNDNSSNDFEGVRFFRSEADL